MIPKSGNRFSDKIMREEKAAPPLTPRRLEWMTASVREVIEETARVRSLKLDVPDWPGHRAGQHADVRLTAEDGY
jgi:hypothetical protein